MHLQKYFIQRMRTQCSSQSHMESSSNYVYHFRFPHHPFKTWINSNLKHAEKTACCKNVDKVFQWYTNWPPPFKFQDGWCAITLHWVLWKVCILFWKFFDSNTENLDQSLLSTYRISLCHSTNQGKILCYGNVFFPGLFKPLCYHLSPVSCSKCTKVCDAGSRDQGVT